MFQFTHPGRGATVHSQFAGVAIKRFNSRTPGGVRLNIRPLMMSFTVFQFTHPGRGATHLSRSKAAVQRVSIHAPREGCDWTCFEARGLMGWFQFTHPGRGATFRPHYHIILWFSFNSRTPGGVRQKTNGRTDLALSFNSRTPGGVRLVPDSDYSGVGMFQFTHPGRGATSSKFVFGVSIEFQFTHPGRGATFRRQ